MATDARTCLPPGIKTPVMQPSIATLAIPRRRQVVEQLTIFVGIGVQPPILMACGHTELAHKYCRLIPGETPSSHTSLPGKTSLLEAFPPGFSVRLIRSQDWTGVPAMSLFTPRIIILVLAMAKPMS